MNYNLPRSGFDSLELKPTQQLLLKVILGAEKIFKFWKYPMKLDPEDQSMIVGIYWLNKTLHPMRRAQKNSGIEDLFRRNHEKLHSDYLKKALPKEFNPDAQVSLSFIGDLMNAKGIENSRDRFFESVASQIFDADISVANLESTMTKAKIEETIFTRDEMPKINATLDQYKAMTRHKDYQFTAFHTANNHILDNGLEGFNTTHDQLEADDLPYFGTNRTAEAQSSGIIIEKKGVKIGFVGWTYSLNLRKFPPGHEYCVNTTPFHNLEPTNDLSPIREQILNLKGKGADFVIVSLHWGLEFEFYPTEKQLRQAHEISEMGADMIISHHSHCIQPTEFYTPKRDPERVIPIVYGLGNFTSILSVPHSALNLISNFTITKGTLKGTSTTYVDSLKLTPVFQRERPSENGKRNYLTAELLADYKDNPVMVAGFEGDIEKMCSYADQILGRGWR